MRSIRRVLVPVRKHRPWRRPPKGVFGHRTRRQEQLIAAVTPPSTARARPRGKGKEARRRKIQARNALRTEADGAPREKKSVRLLDRWIAGGKKSTYLTIRTGVQRDPARFEARTRQEIRTHFLHAPDFGRELCLSTPNGDPLEVAYLSIRWNSVVNFNLRPDSDRAQNTERCAAA